MAKSEVVEMNDIKVVSPKKYKAIIHNDDTTSFEFVIFVLTEVYQKPMDEAVALTMQTHTQGQSIVKYGLRNYLETLADRAMELANQYGYTEFTITNEIE
jgi:ATP-dependent Clp protease adaptor protein ClpS